MKRLAFPLILALLVASGCTSNEEKIRKVRARTKFLVALGDCAVTGNVSAMRNPFSVKSVFERAYVDNADSSSIPSEGLPVLRDVVVPVHHVVEVDLTLPGCPPSADLIHWTVAELLDGRMPDVGSKTRFGA